MKKYNSFAELDEDLRILSLKKQIAFLEFKHEAEGMKEKISKGRFFIDIASHIWKLTNSRRYKIFGIASGFLLRKILKRKK